MRIEIIDRVEGRVLGVVSAPRQFFYTAAFEEWRNQVMAEAVRRAIGRAKDGCYTYSDVQVVVTL